MRRISPSYCRMPIYQPCQKTPSQKLKEFLEEKDDFMVCISSSVTKYAFMVVAMVLVFCIPECPRGHPYMVGEVSAFKILFVTV